MEVILPLIDFPPAKMGISFEYSFAAFLLLRVSQRRHREPQSHKAICHSLLISVKITQNFTEVATESQRIVCSLSELNPIALYISF